MSDTTQNPDSVQSAEIAAGTLRLLIGFVVICLFVVAAAG